MILLIIFFVAIDFAKNRKDKTAKKRFIGVSLVLFSLGVSIVFLEYIFGTPKVQNYINYQNLTYRRGILFPARLNSYGFNDVEHKLEKDKGTYRIVFLGDSMTAGRQSFARQIEDILNKRMASVKIRYETLNFARSGGSTEGELQDFKKFGLNFQPDLIATVFFLNDGETHNADLIAKYVTSFKLFPSNLHEYIMEKYLLYDFLVNSMHNLLEKLHLRKTHLDFIKYIYNENPRSLHYVYDALLEMNSVAKDNGVAFLLITIPPMMDLQNFPWYKEYGMIQDFAKNNGIQVFDLIPYFVGRDHRELWIYKGDWHPNTKAHTIAAKAIADYLLESKIIPK